MTDGMLQIKSRVVQAADLIDTFDRTLARFFHQRLSQILFEQLRSYILEHFETGNFAKSELGWDINNIHLHIFNYSRTGWVPVTINLPYHLSCLSMGHVIIFTLYVTYRVLCELWKNGLTEYFVSPIQGGSQSTLRTQLNRPYRLLCKSIFTQLTEHSVSQKQNTSQSTL